MLSFQAKLCIDVSRQDPQPGAGGVGHVGQAGQLSCPWPGPPGGPPGPPGPPGPWGTQAANVVRMKRGRSDSIMVFDFVSVLLIKVVDIDPNRRAAGRASDIGQVPT